MIKDLILRNRSYRRFFEDQRVEEKTLKDLVELARLSASAANLQPLKYILSFDPKKNSLIFPYLKWAGYLKDWAGPKEGERPSCYIVILNDTRIAQFPTCDHGIAAQSMLLGAVEKGLAGCMIGSIDKEGLRGALKIPTYLEITLVLALGKPKEKVKLEAVTDEKNIKYWRDKDGLHHVPKRNLDDIIIG